MWLNTLWQRWRGRSCPLPSFLTGQRTIRKARHWLRLTLEMLEDRTVPSTLVADLNADLSDVNNPNTVTFGTWSYW
jgi:hypothetical protein